MKSFEEAIGRNAADSVALCMSMENVIEYCEKTIKRQGKNVSMEELHSYTAEFIEKAFEIQSLLPQEVINTDENIRKYNEALWEDIEVAAMVRQIGCYKRMTSATDKENYCTCIGDIKAAIEKENKKRLGNNHARAKKNLAFRYWVGDKAQDFKTVGDCRKKLCESALGWALYPYFAFIWEDGYVPNEIGADHVKWYKPAYILSLFLGESSNTRGHCMFQAFISQVNYSYGRFTDRNRSERRESEEQIDEKREVAIKSWYQEIADNVDLVHDEAVSRIARLKECKEPLSDDGISEIRGIYEAYRDFSDNRLGSMLEKAAEIFSEWEEQRRIDESGKWLQKNGDKMKPDMMLCIRHIWNCIEILRNNSNEAWRNQRVCSADLEYLKGIVKYASEHGILYSRALLMKCLDELTDWVMYLQYVDSMKSEEAKDGTGSRIGRTDFAMYSGIALRQVSVETVSNSRDADDNLYDIGDIAFDTDQLNGSFWHYAAILKNRMAEMLPVKSLKSDSSFSPNAVFEDRLASKFQYHDRIFSRLLEEDAQELGNKNTLCAFFESVYEKRIRENYFGKNS